MSDDFEVVWSGRQFRVLRASVQYPDGSTRIHEQIEAPDVVRVYALAEAGIVLTDEYRADVGGRVFRVPSGRVDAGETPEQAAKRELLEEAGYTAETLELLRVSVPVLKFRHKAWHFVARGLRRVGQNLQDGEDIRTLILPYSDIDDAVFSGRIAEDSIAMSLLTLARREAQERDRG